MNQSGILLSRLLPQWHILPSIVKGLLTAFRGARVDIDIGGVVVGIMAVAVVLVPMMLLSTVKLVLGGV